MADVVEALRARVRRDGSRPLVTYEDLGRGERTELSAVSFANWVDKACHLLDECGVGPGEVLAVPVVAERPGHWAGLVAVMAGWQLGAHVVRDGDAVVSVVGPAHPYASASPAGSTTIVCSLHPLGLPLPATPPAVDFADVLSMPDSSLSYGHAPQHLAWDALTYADLGRLAPESRRVLIEVDDAADVVVDGLVRPLLGGGSAVLVAGSGDLTKLAESERAVRVTGAGAEFGSRPEH